MKALNSVLNKGAIIKITLGCLSFLFLSCATIFNSKRTCIDIVHDKEITQLSMDSCVKVLPRGFCVLRSPHPRKLYFQIDGQKKSVLILPRTTLVYWENILNLGLGFLIDKKTVKRFTYPKKIYLEKSDTLVQVLSFPTINKGSVQLCVLFPYFNSFYIRSSTGYYTSAGFIGVGLGINYFYNKNTYLSINGGVSLDFPYPFPAAIYYEGEHQSASSIFVNIRNHHKYGKFDLGYGFSFSESKWGNYGSTYNEIDSIHIDNTNTRLNSGLGLSLNAKYNLNKKFSFGLVYQPTLINLNHTPRLGYQHFITIEIARTISLKKGK